MGSVRFSGDFMAGCGYEDDRPEWMLEWVAHAPNAPTAEGLQAIADIMFGSASKITTWHIGLIAGDGFEEIAQADVLADHPGWSELTSYSQSTRPQWTPTVTGGYAEDPQVTLFTFAAETKVRGFFLASNSTKGGTTGKLWATALFGAERTVKAGKSLRVTYAVQAAGGG